MSNDAVISRPDGAMGAKRPRRRWPWRLGQAAIGLALGLVIAESAFAARDHRAFPHLNVYMPDASLGVRLRPGAFERVSLGRNPVTSVRINADGLRGADLPPPGPSPPSVGNDEVLMVGDSQVFGLGVEENETASALLGDMMGRTVINAGTPTYGPGEYEAVLEELLAKRPIRTVIYVVNMVNDLFEASHPNVDRHVVWDGWAVRKETAPERVTEFPGRALLFQRSHLVYALRSYLYARGPELDERGFASEGTVADLIGAASHAGDEHLQAERALALSKERRETALKDASVKEAAADAQVEELALDAFELRGYEEGIAYQRSRATAGDIVVATRLYQEGSRSPDTTAHILFKGATVRKLMEERIHALADYAAALEKDPNAQAPLVLRTLRGLDAMRELVKVPTGSKLVKTYAEREALKKKIEQLKAMKDEIARARSPLAPDLQRAKAACDAHGARLLVVALPMDLQVSAAEWAKYDGAKPVDMSPTKILLDDVVATAESLGAAGLDPTSALAAAEPGAFLDGDIHMTPKGHRALAEAIAAKLRDPAILVRRPVAQSAE